MKTCYINGMGCVSAQESTNFETLLDLFKELKEPVVKVHKPTYKAYIKPAMIRRMASGVKNSVVAANIALKEADLSNPDAIITGTGMGCLIDSEKFLKKLIENKEAFLTPTSFIQSTHNTVGGQIALALKCNAYNMTYVHNATSFEIALIDALLMIQEGEESVLVGGVDELGDYTTELYRLLGQIKEEKSLSNGILKSNSIGTVFSEGASFFALGNKKSKNSYAKLIDVQIIDTCTQEEIAKKATSFLATNNLTVAEIDVVVLGINGDKDFQDFYSGFQQTLFKNTQQLYYKHLSGEYNTASAFGLWMAANICKTKSIPAVTKLNNKPENGIKKVLLYNQFRGENHSFTLIESC
ncbi:MAG: beta-ketoacyl synthase chain length factor [Flavobacteriaceae bacterium]|nr:beta-ketoacyl synthase chain length factor [Flavobacteriaceae bacterium]